MAILANLPFCLELRKKNIDDDAFEEVVLQDFYESIFDLKKQPKPELRILENRNLEARLTSSKMDAILDMDGFDGIEVNEILHADGKYLACSYEFTKLFSGEKFPLPPGMYVLKVMVDKKDFYAGFEVVSAVLDDYYIWKSMLSDIMKTIPRQTVDYAYIRSVAKQFAYNEVTPHMLWKMMVLNDGYSRVVAALNDIKCNPHNRLVKSYLLVNKNEVQIQDVHSRKLNAFKNHAANKAYTAKKTISLDLLENRYLKQTLIDLDKNIQLCLDEAKKDMDAVAFDLKNIKYKSDTEQPEYIRKRKVNQFLESQCQKISKLQVAIRALRRVEWIQSLPDFAGPITSTQNFSDPRYNVIFSLYSKLDKISRDYSSDKHMTLLWKRTSLLYEYWNIILLVKSLLKNGFILENNDNAIMNREDVQFKSIASGDSYLFKALNGKYKVKLYYEKAIPSAAIIQKESGLNYYDAENKAKHMTSKEKQPLYTKKSNNTPDCIIDFYGLNERGEEVSYLGALVIDFKYRKRKVLWDNKDEYVYKSNSVDSCKGQFMAYREMRTLYYGECDGSALNTSDKFISPVHEVWALYPNVDEPNKVEFKSGFGIRLISSIPGNEEAINKCMKGFISWLLPDM